MEIIKKIFSPIFNWIVLPLLGILMGIYSFIYYVFFGKNPITVTKVKENENKIHIDFSMWWIALKSIFTKK